MRCFSAIAIEIALASFLGINTFFNITAADYNSWIKTNDALEDFTKIPLPLSVAFLSPLQYVCFTPFRPVQDDKFVNPFVEQTCLTFCLQVTDWSMRALSWSFEAGYLSEWLKQFGSEHRSSWDAGKIYPSSFQSSDFKTVLPSDSVNSHSTLKACSSSDGIQIETILKSLNVQDFTKLLIFWFQCWIWPD